MNRFDNNETGRRYKNVTNYRPMIANYPSQFYFADKMIHFKDFLIYCTNCTSCTSLYFN